MRLASQLGDTARFRLVFAENMEYGFRRNALGLRWGLATAISAASILYWWRIVTPEWVRRPAELYADRLLEGVETLRTSEPGPTAG